MPNEEKEMKNLLYIPMREVGMRMATILAI